MAKTGQDILNQMEILNPELQLQPGEQDVNKALLALNAALYWFENLLALQPDLLGDAKGTVTTVGNTETTVFPVGLLRIDKLQYIDSVTSRPVYDLIDIRATGGHITSPGWPSNVYNFVSSTGASGRPVGYYTDGTSIYWTPLPDSTYTVRWYGFQRMGDITAVATFPYDVSCMLPIASFAVRIIRVGLDDPIDNYQAIATEMLQPTIQMLANFKREKAPGYQYHNIHST